MPDNIEVYFSDFNTVLTNFISRISRLLFNLEVESIEDYDNNNVNNKIFLIVHYGNYIEVSCSGDTIIEDEFNQILDILYRLDISVGYSVCLPSIETYEILLDLENYEDEELMLLCSLS